MNAGETLTLDQLKELGIGPGGALRVKSIAVYEIFEKQAKGIKEGQILSLVWTGKIQDVLVEAEVSAGSRAKVITLLTELDCIEILQRGNSAQSSIVRLIAHPEARGWIEPEKNLRKGLTTGDDSAILRESVRAIQKQLGGLDVVRALADLEGRVSTLSLQVEALQRIQNTKAD